ncbi:merozoite capping protein-1 [Rhexocercosporidium sp. MPI-PUGE-AT-0058]|nr:merozoite capping protein-1 [Rhexocercosporidium sp. MPI-PUGE-AT-0058]
MPPELRKRKAPASEPVAAPPAKKKGPVAKAIAKVKEAVSPKTTKTNGATSASKVAVGETINLEGFGGEIETNDGVKTTLKQLVEESKGGVVLFTYPKASTPGCTTQACMFRDQYAPLTSTGFSIYGLSKDSPKSNTTFKTKQNLPYPLLCDPSSTLIGAIGLKKAPASTARGVFVVDKSGKVLASEAGGPAATVEVVKKLVEGGDAAPALVAAPATAEPKPEVATNGVNGAATAEDKAQAATADEVAATAAKLDSSEAKPVAA